MLRVTQLDFRHFWAAVINLRSPNEMAKVELMRGLTPTGPDANRLSGEATFFRSMKAPGVGGSERGVSRSRFAVRVCRPLSDVAVPL